LFKLIIYKDAVINHLETIYTIDWQFRSGNMSNILFLLYQMLCAMCMKLYMCCSSMYPAECKLYSCLVIYVIYQRLLLLCFYTIILCLKI